MIRCTECNNKLIEEFAPEAMKQLENHAWPGNVRELQNVIERAIIRSKSGQITSDDLGISITDMKMITLQDMRHELVIDALKTSKWNISKTAKKLGITRPTLYKYMKEYNIIKP